MHDVGVAELADAQALGACGETRESSTLSSDTNLIPQGLGLPAGRQGFESLHRHKLRNFLVYAILPYFTF